MYNETAEMILPRDSYKGRGTGGKEVTNKLNSLEGKPAEFCVEKIRQSVVLYAANSVIRF